ncbi:MAG: biotin transporter BioY [Alphaproteobacteria bacterium]|jgi:biotin transport system substrate-specific component
MIENQKLSAARAVRMPTLAEAMLDSLMTPSAATSAVTKAALVVFGSLLLAVSAQFKIPLYPVPVTGQTLVVLLIGMTYGPRLGGITLAAYLFEGALGLPVFAGGAAGVAVLMGPTAGYLFGFLLAAIAMGYLAERGMGRTVVSTIAAMVIGNCVIYLCGALWLANFIGFGQAIAAGVLPFLYGDALKLVVAAGLMPWAWRAVKSAK